VDERTCLIALAMTKSIGWILAGRLYAHFGSYQAVLEASESELRHVQGIGAQTAASITAIDLAQVAVQLAAFSTQQITASTWQEETYPTRLAALSDRPLVVYSKGHQPIPPCRTVAIVGTREAQPESIQLARDWAAGFAERGWTIISGLARGIDTAAHRGAMEATNANQQFRTVAVFGSGVNVIYPPENRHLADQVMASGAILSEVHPNTAPSPNGLMRRNRLIAALSEAVIIVEAGQGSGALHAAHCAEMVRLPLYAVNNSEGNAELLSRYARPLPDSVDLMISEIESGTG
jgi:DNA processing protein